MWITFLNDLKLTLLQIVKLFQVLMCITNNSIKNQSFIYAHWINQTVLFQTIQLSITQQS